jgi:acyl-CoA synthetase (NDP forming)
VYAVNPAADTIAGILAYPSIAVAPQRPDLVVIAVPAPRVAAVLSDAAAAGARAAVILSSGFGEDGPQGKARQAELVRIARDGGMRIVGPNCLGFLNTDPAVRLHATFAAAATPGGLAVASQSGAVGISLLDQAAKAGLGISSFVSLGNKADVSGNDLLSYWYDDPAAKVVALYLESLGNPRRFARIARAVARRKPVLAVKSGRSAAGSRVGASHTAAAAAPDATVDALFAQAGVIRCDGLGDLLDTARIFVGQPLPAGDRIAIVGNAGGINVLCADAADAAALTLPELPAAVQAAIRMAAPAAAATSNPVDLGAAVTADAMNTAIRTIAPHVDAIVVAFGATLAADVPGIVDAIGGVVDGVPIPAAVVLLGVTDAPTNLGARRAPVYALPEDAIGALGRAVRYARWRRAPLGERPELTGIDAACARRIVAGALTTGGGWQPPNVAGDLLDCYGIRVVAVRETATSPDAVAAATTIGFPVVVKSANTELVHKTDIGGVRLSLDTADAVTDAYRDIVAATGDPRVLVQAQASAGIELVAGIAHDPLFGSVLMCGLGGVHTDLLGDRTLRLLPVTDRDAAQMWRDLRAAPLLTGYRGAPPVDTAAVEDLLLRLGRLAEDLPEVAELDLNPIIVGTAALAIVDVKIRLAAVGTEPDSALRSLREPV